MHPEILPSKRFLNTDDAAEYLTALGLPITSQTLRHKRSNGTGPLFRKWTGRVVYAVSDLETWANDAMTPPVSNTAEARTMTRRAAGARA